MARVCWFWPMRRSLISKLLTCSSSTHAHCWPLSWGYACWESTLLLNCIPAVTIPCLYPPSRPQLFWNKLTEWLGLGLHSFCISLPSSWCARLKFLKFVLLLFLRLYLNYVLTVLTQLALNSCTSGITGTHYQACCFLLFCFALLCWDRVSIYDLKPKILLFQPPKCRDYRCVLSSTSGFVVLYSRRHQLSAVLCYS